MFTRQCTGPLLILLAVTLPLGNSASAQEMSTEDAWQALPRYEYGQDLGALLAIDRAVIKAMGSPESRSACAARLAGLLVDAETTLAARQHICLQLRQVGTPAEVPILAQLQNTPETSEMARQALQAIPGPESAEALRSALGSLSGKPLVGVINSCAARRDTQAVTSLQQLANSPDTQVAAAALWALGTIGDQPSTLFLAARAAQAPVPTPQQLAIPLLRCAERAAEPAAAQAIFVQLSKPGQAAGVRRAALEGLLRLQGTQATETVLAWLTDADAERQLIATGHLRGLSNDQLDSVLARLPQLPRAGQMAVIGLAASRRGRAVLPWVTAMIGSDKPELKLAGVRCLGLIGDASAIPALIDMLAEEGAASAAAQDALVDLPRPEVTSALLDALRNRSAIRVPVIAVLVKLKCYDAIDPLLEIASQSDPAVYDPALTGLRGIADPDKTDIPRLVKLLLKTDPGRHRDEVEKTILVVSQKLPEGADRSELVHTALTDTPASLAPTYLPLLGRLGGSKSLQQINSALQSDDAAVRQAAMRGLCNWPDADVADQLRELAQQSADKTFRHWSLRAYIRVVTLESERPASETLTMLQHAMKLAEVVSDRQLVLERASTIRTLDAVSWIATYVDDPELQQAACSAIVELAHHRFLRHPNMKTFGPLLEKAERISDDPAIVERARRYRLGL